MMFIRSGRFRPTMQDILQGMLDNRSAASASPASPNPQTGATHDRLLPTRKLLPGTSPSGASPSGASLPYLYGGLALLSGAILPIQANLNAQLAQSLTSVPLAVTISCLVGTTALMVLLLSGLMGRPHWRMLTNVPRWSFLGGILGVIYIAVSAYFISILGTTLTLGFVVLGQTIAGLIIDHFGWLGVPRHRLNRPRQFATGLLAAALFFLVQ